MPRPDDYDELEDEREEDEEDYEEDDEDREEWLEEVEEEYIAQGDISVSETVDGHEAIPDLDEEDILEDEFDEGMHEEDEDADES